MHGAIALKKEIPLEGQALDAFLAMKEIIRRAIQTLASIRDPDERFRRGLKSGWTLPVVYAADESYGYNSATYRFVPSPHDISQMEIVNPWLVWVRQEEGIAAIRRITAWAMGAPCWKIGMREGCSEKAIRNRIDRSVRAIIAQFAGANLAVEAAPVEEVAKADDNPRHGRAGGPFSLVTEKSPGPHGNKVRLMKVYIHDMGFMKGAKRLRDGREKIERMAS